MKLVYVTASILLVATFSHGCADTHAAEAVWEASLLDNSEPWTGSDMNWLLDELNLDVYRFEADLPQTGMVKIVWEFYQNGKLVERDESVGMSLDAGLARGRVMLKREGESLAASFSIQGKGTSYTFHSLKDVNGPSMRDIPGTITTASASEPFFALVEDSDGKQLDSENMYSPELHDQAIYLYVVRK